MSLNKLTATRLTDGEVNGLVKTLLSEILPLEGLEEAILFGSASRGEMTDASDLDIVLIFDSQDQAKAASKTAHAKRKKSAIWPTDLLCVDRPAYEERAKIGGVFFVARDEGRTIYKRGLL